MMKTSTVLRTAFFGLLLLSPAMLPAPEAPRAKPMLGTLPAGRVLFLGNSITLHGPAPDIGWTGNWGMAASAADKDYVHLLAADMAKATGAQPRTMVRNIADFERGYETFNVAAALKAELEFDADIVIVAIGENVPDPATAEARAKFAAAFARLLAALQQQRRPAILVRSCFWPNATKDGIMRKASADAGATFVDIGTLGRDEANAARSERKFKHAGVAGHPGDKGMRAIADAIFAALLTSAAAASPNPVHAAQAVPKTTSRLSAAPARAADSNPETFIGLQPGLGSLPLLGRSEIFLWP
jgi:hypothetical protein